MSRLPWIASLVLVSILVGCTIGAEGFATDFHSIKEGSLQVSTTEPLVGQDGRCEANADPSSLRPLGPQGVPLGSTECEVIARLGGPYSVEIRRGAAGERLVSLMYVSGAKLGIYHFVNNRLARIEH